MLQGGELSSSDAGQEHPAVLHLVVDDLDQVQLADDQEERDDRKAEGEFVGDQLRGGADRAQKRVFGVGRPTREDDAVDAQRRDGEDKERADVDVGNDHRNARDAASERDHGQRDDGGGDAEAGGDPVVKFLHVGRGEVFL